jgi:O-antigen/teichoic acid export membrane protein
MQDAKEHLERSVTRSVFFICFLVFPALVGLLVLAPILVKIIPRYTKWEPALLPLGLIAINTTFAAVTTQLTNLLNAIGKIRITFKLMVMWTVLTWLFVPALAVKFGVVGAALGYALVGVSSLVAIVIARRQVRFSLTNSALKPFLASVVMGGVLIFLRGILPTTLPAVWLLILAGAATYAITIYLLVGTSLKRDVTKSFKTLLGR